MGLGAFVAGAYSVAFDEESLGISREGYNLTFTPKGKAVDRTDAYGATIIEVLQNGGNWSLQCDSLEWKPGPQATLTQFSAGIMGQLNEVGTCSSANGRTLTMSVTNGTAAAEAGAINTLSAVLATLAPNMDLSLLFDSTLREFPIKLLLLPFLATGGVVRHFSTT